MNRNSVYLWCGGILLSVGRETRSFTNFVMLLIWKFILMRILTGFVTIKPKVLKAKTELAKVSA